MKQNKEEQTLSVGCIVTTNGGQQHTIAKIGFGGEEGVAEDCFYRWDKDYPYEIEHAAMDPAQDAIVSISWPNAKADS